MTRISLILSNLKEDTAQQAKGAQIRLTVGKVKAILDHIDELQLERFNAVDAKEQAMLAAVRAERRRAMLAEQALKDAQLRIEKLTEEKEMA